MKLSRAMMSVGLLCALSLPVTARAQDHGGHGEHGQSAGEHGQSAGEHGQTAGEHGQSAGAHGQTAGEHGQSAGAHGAHHGPEEINWTQFGGTRGEHGGAQKPNPPPFISTLINFALLVAILFFAVKRAINPSLATRRAALEADIAEAQRLLTEAEAMHREYSERMEKSQEEFSKIRDEMLAAGRTEAQRILDEARARAERMQTEGQALIEQELRGLKAELTREAVESAMKGAEQAVRSATNAQDHARLADQFVNNLDKVALGDRGAA